MHFKNVCVGVYVCFLAAILAAVEVHVNPAVYYLHNFPDCLEAVFVGISFPTAGSAGVAYGSLCAGLTGAWYAGVAVLAALALLALLGRNPTWKGYTASFGAAAAAVLAAMLVSMLVARRGGSDEAVAVASWPFFARRMSYALLGAVALAYALLDGSTARWLECVTDRG